MGEGFLKSLANFLFNQGIVCSAPKNLRPIHFSIYFLFFCCHLAAQGQLFIQGTLIDSISGEPLQSASVSIDGIFITSTDWQGKFEVKMADTLPRYFQVKYLGYIEFNLELTDKFVKSNVIDLGVISLIPSQTLLNEVAVSAESRPYRSISQGTNYYISPQLVKEIQPLSTEELLRTVPGINVIGDMGLANRMSVSVRGSWGRRSEKVLIMEDGSPISPAPYISPGIYYNPASERVDALEVIMGADVLRYGPNNMYGVINFITSKPPQETEFKARITAGERGFFGGLISYGGTFGNLGFQLEGMHKQFDGFTDNSSVLMQNFNTKLYAELSSKQSLLVKLSAQFEDNQATWASITPYTFDRNPLANPFDADQFKLARYGLDAIHKYVGSSGWILSSRFNASDFSRDWFRQINRLIPVSDLFSYIGSDRINTEFSYIKPEDNNPDWWVRVGTINGQGRESTINSRWRYLVTGIEEKIEKRWKSSNGSAHHLEYAARYHRETYNDIIIRSDSSRWARSGMFTRDLYYIVEAFTSYIRHHFQYGKFSCTPIIRLEHVLMRNQDLLANSRNPGNTGVAFDVKRNKYTVFQPGFSVGYQFSDLKLFGSLYQGYIAPSKYFAFLVEREGIITTPDPDEVLNIRPELSWNKEVGIRGSLPGNRFHGQVAYFHNKIRNFYLAGWNEFFERLATMQVQGLESSLQIEIIGHSKSNQQLQFSPSFTYNTTQVISGSLRDDHLFSEIVHSTSTKTEFINNHNTNPQAYRVFVRNTEGNLVPFNGVLDESNLSNVARVIYEFGEGKIENGRIPYTPVFSAYGQLLYRYKKLSTAIRVNYVGAQYTEFANFTAESADGAIGRLDPFWFLDFNMNYQIKRQSNTYHFFISAKNVNNQIVRVSRLNRANSGIMPGGFRQLNAGIILSL
jgi:Fe(3+) dicitrate transport protein